MQLTKQEAQEIYKQNQIQIKKQWTMPSNSGTAVDKFLKDFEKENLQEISL